jgi:rare lipoprotein A
VLLKYGFLLKLQKAGFMQVLCKRLSFAPDHPNAVMNLCATVLVFLFTLWPNEPTFVQEGSATYYADYFQGRRTTSGERYKATALTAAHKTLPFNTIVKVTNLRNERTVEVRINDRLGKKSPMILDLSKAAAKQIGLFGQGVGTVKLEVFSIPAVPGTSPAGDSISVQG